MDLRTFNRLKQEVEGARSEAERAKGARDSVTNDLKDRYKVKDTKEAYTLLKKLREEEADASEELKKRQTDFEEKWDDKL